MSIFIEKVVGHLDLEMHFDYKHRTDSLREGHRAKRSGLLSDHFDPVLVFTNKTHVQANTVRLRQQRVLEKI